GSCMEQRAPLEIVRAWIAAANAQDTSRLIQLSDPNIEISGPRGSGIGQKLLRGWLARAGLALETTRAFARGHVVVLEQRGVWRSLESGAVTGERALASAFRTDERRVVWFGRYDDLATALKAADIARSDELR
ncbi:MAG: hypothetical protein ACRDHE_05490, partial [Ktedonobacterales bacterium]